MNLDVQNEDSTVQSFLSQLRNKEVVQPEFLHDLGVIGGKETVPKPQLYNNNPVVKMQARQHQVISLLY